MKITVIRTHRFGQLLPEHEREPVSGPVETYSMPHPELKRGNLRLKVVHRAKFGAEDEHSVPELHDPTLLKYSSDRVMVVSGFEEIERRRYYQTWFIKFEG